MTDLGHDVRLMPASAASPGLRSGVKSSVKWQKTDAPLAEAVCEAVARPKLRFVPVKSAEQQAMLHLHRTCDFLVRPLMQIANSIRAHMTEFGLVVAQGVYNIEKLLEQT